MLQTDNYSVNFFIINASLLNIYANVVAVFLPVHSILYAQGMTFDGQHIILTT